MEEMIYFSIVLVSRSRPAMMLDLYRSIKNTSKFHNEILIGLDSDDDYLDNYIDIFSGIENVRLFIEERNSNLHIRINQLLPYVKGKYIFVLNDDCKLIDGSWDKDSIELLDGFGDIVYGRTYDNSIDRVSNTYAAFPIVSNIAANKLGFIMDETFGNHGSDVMTYRIYEGANKIVDLPRVRIDHVLHNSVNALQDRKRDKTASDMINRTFSDDKFSVNSLFSVDISKKSDLLI
jgi:glycosyltransferase involved in cell wall biosynthesis